MADKRPHPEDVQETSKDSSTDAPKEVSTDAACKRQCLENDGTGSRESSAISTGSHSKQPPTQYFLISPANQQSPVSNSLQNFNIPVSNEAGQTGTLVTNIGQGSLGISIGGNSLATNSQAPLSPEKRVFPKRKQAPSATNKKANQTIQRNPPTIKRIPPVIQQVPPTIQQISPTNQQSLLAANQKIILVNNQNVTVVASNRQTPLLQKMQVPLATNSNLTPAAKTQVTPTTNKQATPTTYFLIRPPAERPISNVTSKRVPNAAGRQVPNSASRQTPNATSTRVPNAADRQVPNATSTQVPDEAARQVPYATNTQAVPVMASAKVDRVTSEAPSTASSEHAQNVGTSRQKQQPSAALDGRKTVATTETKKKKMKTQHPTPTPAVSKTVKTKKSADLSNHATKKKKKKKKSQDVSPSKGNKQLSAPTVQTEDCPSDGEGSLDGYIDVSDDEHAVKDKSQSQGSNQPELIDNMLQKDRPMTSGERRALRNRQLDKACQLFKRLSNKVAFRVLSKTSEAVRLAMVACVVQMVKKELKSRKNTKSVSLLRNLVTPETLEAFSWGGVMNEAKKSLPMTYRCIRALVPHADNARLIQTNPKFNMTYFDGQTSTTRELTPEEAEEVADRRAGLVLSLALQTRHLRDRFLSRCVALQMYRYGANRKLSSETLNHLGVSCFSSPSLKRILTEAEKAHQKKVVEWKDTLKDLYENGKRLTKLPTYGFCGEAIVVRSFRSKYRNHEDTINTMSYAAKDRAQVQVFTSLRVHRPIMAVDLNPFTFLPSAEVLDRQRARAVFIVQRILLTYFCKLEGLHSKMPSRFQHKFLKVMQEKSEIVPLGTFNGDPNTPEGTTSVIDKLQKHVVESEDRPVPCLMGGSCETIDNILQAHRTRMDGDNWRHRFDGLRACPQEFHKEVRLLHDSNSKFFNMKSEEDRGTIAELKAMFGRRLYQFQVMDHCRPTLDMYKFITEAHILMYAMKLCGMSSLDDVPAGFPSSRKNAWKAGYWLTQLASRIVDFFWMEPDEGDIRVAVAAYDDKNKNFPEKALRYCVCRKVKKEHMILCHSRLCKHSWYHPSCIGLTKPPDPEEEWYCSQECKKSYSSIYCICHLKQSPTKETEMVQCHLGKVCRKYEWYHRGCLGIEPEEELPDPWYCGDACAIGTGDEDYVLNYTKALVNEGLWHLVRQDAVSEGNGPAMIEDWKTDMLRFYEKPHYRFLASGHLLLACAGGFVEPHIQHNVIWNRVVNPSGKPGGNIGFDEYVHEEKKEILEMLKKSKMTPEEMKDWLHLDGFYRDSLDKILGNPNPDVALEKYEEEVSNEYIEDIEDFIKEYQKDALYDLIPGRQHSAFPEFTCYWKVKNPKVLGIRLKHLSMELDNKDPNTPEDPEDR